MFLLRVEIKNCSENHSTPVELCALMKESVTCATQGWLVFHVVCTCGTQGWHVWNTRLARVRRVHLFVHVNCVVKLAGVRRKVGACSSCALVCTRELCSEVGIWNSKTFSALGLKSLIKLLLQDLGGE